MLLAELTWYEDSRVISLELGRDASDGIGISASTFSCNDALVKLDLTCDVQVVATLLHDHIETGQILIPEVHAWLGHVSVDDLVEDLHVGGCVAHDALNEALVTIRTETSKVLTPQNQRETQNYQVMSHIRQTRI